MTDQDPDRPADDGYATVDAFLDGEGVDPRALTSALADAATREYFVDLLILRDAVALMGSTGGAVIARTGRPMSGFRWMAAAAALVASLTAGYLAGQRVMAASAPLPSVEAAVHIDGAPAAPTPTQVIPLRPGVNWTELPGGR